MEREPEFVGLKEAVRLTGIARETLLSLVERGELPLYRLPLDRRVKLFKLSEIEALREPVLVEPQRELAGATA